jgi:hypothetical protein
MGIYNDSGLYESTISADAVDANTTHRSSDGTDHADVGTNTSDIATNVTAIGLNTTHKGSNGTDHSYIDQNVTSGSSPTFDGTNLTELDAPTLAEWCQNGFENTTDSTLAWTDSSPDRTLSIQPTSSSFNYWIAGVKYTSTGDTVQITDIEGIHGIYYDGSTLTALANPTNAQFDSLIRTKSLVSILYWDTSASTAIYVGEERHGKIMTPSTHSYLHFINGLQYISGLGLNTLSADGTGVTADAQFGIDAGAVTDEDLYQTISAVTSTTGLPIYYMLGASAEWQKYTESGFSVRTSDGTASTRLAWNEYTGGAWQLTEVGNNDFVLCHVFATTEKDNPMIAILGQGDYATKPAARNGAETEIRSLVLDDILFPEMHPIATVIFQTNTSYASAVNGKVVTTADGDNYVDWRSEVISRTELTTSNHNSLSGLQGGTTNEYYHLTSTEYSALGSSTTTTSEIISTI